MAPGGNYCWHTTHPNLCCRLPTCLRNWGRMAESCSGTCEDQAKCPTAQLFVQILSQLLKCKKLRCGCYILKVRLPFLSWHTLMGIKIKSKPFKCFGFSLQTKITKLTLQIRKFNKKDNVIREDTGTGKQPLLPANNHCSIFWSKGDSLCKAVYRQEDLEDI